MVVNNGIVFTASPIIISKGTEFFLHCGRAKCSPYFPPVGGEGFGIGSTPPGAQYPFGLVRLSPDTASLGNIALDDWHFGGYHYGQYSV